jgi:hypothetical protein
MFPLFCACGDTVNEDYCIHSEEEPCVVGTLVLDEFCKAVEMGNGLLGVIEISEYAAMCFDKETNSDGFCRVR